jgi:hypothetical protein
MRSREMNVAHYDEEAEGALRNAEEPLKADLIHALYACSGERSLLTAAAPNRIPSAT